MIVSFTGSQSGMTNFQMRELKKKLISIGITELVHGDCVGSDLLANEIAREIGVKFFYLFPSVFNAKRAFCFPPDGPRDTWIEYADTGINYKLHTPMKPLERNKLIIEQSPLLLATPKEFAHTLRSGTWATIRYAWKLKKDVIIIPPVKDMEEQDNGE